MKDKAKLRQIYKTKRRQMKNKTQKDALIFSKLINCPLYKNCNTVFTYVSSEIEVDTLTFIRYALKDGKTVAAPICNTEDCTMQFYIIKSLNDLEEGAYSIREPKAYCEKAFCDENTLCVVPGLSFDKKGYRLGFGKGYYDRFLSAFLGKTLGLCYNECICEELIHNKYDKTVSAVIAENEIYYTE